MSDPVETLVNMGFSKRGADLAISRTGSKDVPTLMDWILEHQDEISVLETTEETTETGTTTTTTTTTSSSTSAAPEPSTPEVSEAPGPESSSATLMAKSIKCDDCGKLFETNEEVEFHASKSGHENFSESTEEKKPLTEEEKKEQLAKIEAKLKQRRLERENREKQEALERERARIKSGKDLLEAKKKHEELEMKKLIEQRKREKEEERVAKQRVRDQIEADKLARKAKFSPQQEQPAPVVVLPAAVEKKPATTNYTEVKLQIKLQDGKTLVQTFGIKEPLSAVRLFVKMNMTDGDGPFKLMTSFPRKIFTTEDYEKPLESLDLAPTATLIVSKS